MSNTAVTYQFKADVSSLTAGLENVKSQLAAMGASARAQAANMATAAEAATGAFEGTRGALEKLALVMATFAASATAYLEEIGRNAVKLGDAIRTAAGAFDQTTTTMSEVKAVADRAGLSMNDLGKAFLDIQTKAKSGDDVVTHALAAIGLSASDVANLTQRELAMKMAETFSSLKDSSNKAAAGVALFGSDVASKLVPQLDRGRDAIADIMNAASRAGAVIGPELSAKIAGTSDLWAKFRDRAAELAATFTGSMLQNFERYKGAIDAIIMSFTDLVGNISTVIEKFGGLNTAGEHSGQQFNILTTAANYLAEAIVKLTAGAEEMALRFAKAASEIGLSFDGLTKVVEAFGNDIVNIGEVKVQSFVNEWNVGIANIARNFDNLGLAAERALRFDFSGVKAAMEQYREQKKEGEDALTKAQNPDYFASTHAAWDAMTKSAEKYKLDISGATAEIEKQKQAQLDLLHSGGAPGKPGGKIVAGNPSVPDTKSQISDAKDAVDRYLDSLNKANKTAQAELATWMDSNVERAKAVALAQLQAAAEKDGVTLTEQQKQKAIDLATATQTLKDRLEAVRNAAQGLTDTLANALDDLIVKGGKFNDVMKQVLQTLASAALKAALTGQGMFGGLFGGQAGTGGLLGGAINSLFAGFRADGGPVLGGKAYVVGERGPELFQPNGGGTIIPNGGGGGGPGGGPTNITVSVVGANGDAQIMRMVHAGVSAGLQEFSRQVLPGRINDISLRGA